MFRSILVGTVKLELATPAYSNTGATYHVVVYVIDRTRKPWIAFGKGLLRN
jgi:hypothetical protein